MEPKLKDLINGQDHFDPFHFAACRYIMNESKLTMWTFFDQVRYAVSNVEEVNHKEIQALILRLNRDLITLAASLKGRLSPTEEDTLANLFQVQMNLQARLNEASSKPSNLSSSLLSHSQPKDNDSIAYAQALQYARDFVKAMRQKKEHQRRLELTSQQLIRAEKLATVGQVAATVAHELNNILTPLLMYAKLIYKETADSGYSEVAEFASQITKIANRASDMLRQLVDASRNESTITLPVDIVEVINNTLTLLTPRMSNQDIKFQLKYPDHRPLVMVNPSQMEQVFINIMLNACDAMPDGGTFTITINPEVDRSNFELPDHFIHVYLSDTGEGINKEHLSNVFDPFFTTKARGAGAGLGLFVSYLIINQHNGVIEVESERGVGTTFLVKLPIASRDEHNVSY